MRKEDILDVLKRVGEGRLPVEEAFKLLKNLPFETTENAHIDHHRELRQGVPEVVFGEGKRLDDVVEIADRIFRKSGRVLITRSSEEVYRKLKNKGARFYPQSGCITIGDIEPTVGDVLVITAGTSDVPVGEEALVTLRFLGSRAEALYDLGVAGIHRILSYKDKIENARVIIVVAGMEGALPSVVGGITSSVVIGVPTSTGYGASLGGLTALFSMLNSCVPGVAVVNIDNGFGAGCLAHKINSMVSNS